MEVTERTLAIQRLWRALGDANAQAVSVTYQSKVFQMASMFKYRAFVKLMRKKSDENVVQSLKVLFGFDVMDCTGSTDFYQKIMSLTWSAINNATKANVSRFFPGFTNKAMWCDGKKVLTGLKRDEVLDLIASQLETRVSDVACKQCFFAA